MVLEKLGSSLKETLQKIAKSMFVDDKLINELVKDIQRALLQADVNVKLVFELTAKIREKALKHETPSSISKKEHLIKIVYDELTEFLGGEIPKLDVSNKKPFMIMLLGLFGAGKTTTAGKLARYFTKRGYKVALIGLDTHRLAAMEQIEQVAKQANIPVFLDKQIKDPLKIWNNYEKELQKFDIIIIDTAGRDALSQDLIEEIEAINNRVKADENLLVISADIGQAAQKQSEQFHKSCGITGVIITKMDGTAKGGGALSACSVTKAPVKFIGVGEKLDDLELFNPKGFVGRLLGMGDIETLLAKASEAITEEEAQDLGEKFLKGDFSLIDLYMQMEAVKKMGPLGKIMEMVPGMGQLNMPKELLEIQEEKLKKWKFAMDSMTKKELEDPEILSSTRIIRIANGSGVQASEVRELVKQYRQSKKMMKMFKGTKDVNKMMKKFQSMQSMLGNKGLKLR